MSGTLINGNGAPRGPTQRLAQVGANVPVGSLVTPGGDSGPPGVQGPAGPNQVSADIGNTAKLGTDNFIYVPPYPYADATQGGLLRQLDGNTLHYVDGTNNPRAMPIASTANPGDLNTLSGKNSDYVSGNNTCLDLWTNLYPSSDTRYILRTGDTIPNTAGATAFDTQNGLAASSWSYAPLRVEATVGGGARPQIGFYYPGAATSLYFEPTDLSMRHITSDGVARVIFDDHRNNAVNSGYYLYIYGAEIISSNAYIQLAAGCTFYADGTTLFRNGANAYVQSGATLVIQAGGQFLMQGSSTISGTSYISNGASLNVQGGGTINVQSGGTLNAISNGSAAAIQVEANPFGLTVFNECGIASTSFYKSTLYIKSTSSPGRPGIAFHQIAVSYGCFLYYDSDNKFRFVDASGTVHTITSS